VVQATLRRSWTPPAQFAWLPFSWQLRQTLLWSAGFRALMEGVGTPSFPSIWAFAWSAAPAWQLAQLSARPACLLWRNAFETAPS
jgi:hypothetical protein